jgi:Zn-dependent protease
VTPNERPTHTCACCRRGPLIALAALPAIAPAQRGDLDAIGMALVLLLLILSLSFHECMHAWVALQRGDPTGRDLGRITLNPLPHIDLFMTVVLPAIFYFSTNTIFGAAKPVPVDTRRLRNPTVDMALVAFAGPFTNLVLALFFLALYLGLLQAGLYAQGQRLPMVLERAFLLNVVLAVFNLVPIPPLDGSRVMSSVMPPSLRAPYQSLERFGILILLGLLYFFPPFGDLLRAGVNAAARVLYGLVRAAGIG